MSKFKVSVVIPNYNGRDLLKKNLPFVIEARNNPRNYIDEIIIVDDASLDRSVEFIKENFRDIRLIKHKKNRGFSVSVNTGVRGAKGALIVLLNTDVVPEKHFLESVFRHFESEGVFAVSLHEKGYGWARGKFENGFVVHRPGGEVGKTHTTFWVSGGSGVFRRSMWMKLKGMDEKLFKFYWEDVDLSYRAQKRGWEVLWEPGARVLHEHESTIASFFKKKKLQRMQEKNQLVFIWKNLTSPILFRRHLLGLLKRAMRNPGYLIIVIIAFSKLRKIRKARRKEIKEGKISDEAIFSKFS